MSDKGDVGNVVSGFVADIGGLPGLYFLGKEESNSIFFVYDYEDLSFLYKLGL